MRNRGAGWALISAGRGQWRAVEWLFRFGGRLVGLIDKPHCHRRAIFGQCMIQGRSGLLVPLRSKLFTVVNLARKGVL